jgi:hypothetical protein
MVVCNHKILQIIEYFLPIFLSLQKNNIFVQDVVLVKFLGYLALLQQIKYVLEILFGVDFIMVVYVQDQLLVNNLSHSGVDGY